MKFRGKLIFTIYKNASWEFFWPPKNQKRYGWCLPLLVLILIKSIHSLSFEKIGLSSLVDFGTNTRAKRVCFFIPVVANRMRSLGLQTVDRRLHR